MRDTRTLILDAAEQLFAANGFDATATAAVAAAAGVPKGLIFYYFPTKQAILSALVAERIPPQRLPNLASVVRPGDPAASLRNLDAALELRGQRSSVLRVILWREADGHPDVRAQMRKVRDQLLEVTARVLQASTPVPVSAGDLRACAAAWVSALLSIATNDRLRALDGLDRTDDVDTLSRVVAAALPHLGVLNA